MNSSENKKIQDFLDHLKAHDPASFEIVAEIREIIFNTHLKADKKIMYGGIVFFLEGEMFSGVFVNKNHITIEFSKGFLMEDPDNQLEGKGKYRRHLKVRTRADITNKEVAFFVKQAV